MNTIVFFVLAIIIVCGVQAIVIQTDLGQWEGSESEYSYGFNGIPYALPPVGDRRWRVPETNEGLFSQSFSGNFTNPGPACIQTSSVISKEFPFGYSEDCLTLNIEIPKSALNSETNSFGGDLPVMVFIHGGGFTIGMGKEFYVREEEFVKRDVIFVSINYRLSIFGFLSLPELRQENPNAYNFGLLDQRMALGWIISHIHHFGGDNKKITIFGESAGAMSVLWQVTADESHLPDNQSLHNLYGAIAQSPADIPIISCVEVDKIYTNLLKDYVPEETSFLKGLRDLDAEYLIYSLPGFPENRKLMFHTLNPNTPYLMPCTHDGVFSKSYRDAIATENFNSNPNYIIGTCNDEGTLFTFLTYMGFENNDADSFSAMFHSCYPKEDALKLVDKYLSYRHLSLREILDEYMGDAYFQVGSYNLANQISNKQPNTYRYVFNQTDLSNSGPPEHLKVFHGSDLGYIFHLSEGGLTPEFFTDEQEIVSMAMIDYWVNFAKTGNPSPPGSSLVEWPKYSKDKQYTQNLKYPIHTLESYRQEICDFWNNIYPSGLPWMGECSELVHEKHLSWAINSVLFYCLARARKVLAILGIFGILFLMLLLKCCCKKKQVKSKQE